MKLTFPARKLEHNHFQFLPETGVRLLKNTKIKKGYFGSTRTDGHRPYTIKAGDLFAFDETHALFARTLFEVCKAAQISTFIDAYITDEGLLLNYQDGDIKTRVTLKWHNAFCPGFAILIPCLDRECKIPLYENKHEASLRVKRPACKRHAKYPTRPMLAKDWLAAVGAVSY